MARKRACRRGAAAGIAVMRRSPSAGSEGSRDRRSRALTFPRCFSRLIPAIPRILRRCLFTLYHGVLHDVVAGHVLWPTRWPIRTMPNLTDVDVRNAKEGEHTDGDGLILVVRASRSGGKPRRSWVLRIVDGGRRRKLGLGVYPSVSLAQARQKAQDARRELAEGNDPSITAKRRAAILEAARTLTLGKAIDDYLAKAAPAYKNVTSVRIRERAFEFISPRCTRVTSQRSPPPMSPAYCERSSRKRRLRRTPHPRRLRLRHDGARAAWRRPSSTLPIRGDFVRSAGRQSRRGRPCRIRPSTGDGCLNSWPSWRVMTASMRDASPSSF